MEKIQEGGEVTSRIEETSELIKRLCLSELQVRIYSVDHSSAKKMIRSAYDWLIKMIDRKKGPVVISMSEGKMLLEGLPVEEKNPMARGFASRFDKIHVNNLFFNQGLTYEEFENLHRILGKGARYITGYPNGLMGLFKENHIDHIETKEVSYVMVTEDEKVVSKDAKVIDAKILSGAAADAEIVDYMIREVLKKAEERKWLINEIKNNPKKMADLITEGIELATSRVERGLAKEDETIESLLSNIRMVGQGLVDEQTGQIVEGQEDLEDAIISLEGEVRTRSKKLMSSKAALGFVNEILGVVASFSDKVKAKRITQEFIKGEKTLKQTERLLRTFTPKTESADKFLLRIRNLLMERGMKEEELLELLSKVKRLKKPKRPYFSKATLEGIRDRLKDLDLDKTRLDKVIENLAAFFDRRLTERAGEFRLETQRLTEELIRRNIFLEGIDRGVVIWDGEGKVDFINQRAKDALGLERGTQVRWELIAAIKSRDFPIVSLQDEYSDEKGWSNEDRRILFSISKPIKDESGEVIGALSIDLRDAVLAQ